MSQCHYTIAPPPPPPPPTPPTPPSLGVPQYVTPVGEVGDPIDVQRHHAIAKQSDKLLGLVREKQLLVGGCRKEIHGEMEQEFTTHSVIEMEYSTKREICSIRTLTTEAILPK